MSLHEAPRTVSSLLREAHAVTLAERGNFPDGSGQHRAPVDGPTELRNNIRMNEILTGES